MQAMILAAGFGTRLLPYTKNCPKPLFPLLNEPLLLLTIKRLQNAGFDHIIVNCHYLREQIVTALNGLKGVVVQEEKTVLGTGGGLRMALPAMRDEPLLISNGDIYHSIDFKELYQSHEEGDAPVTMAMHDYPRFNKVVVKHGLVKGIAVGGEEGCQAFTGLHVLDPEVLRDIPETGESCIIDRYRQLLAEGGKIQGNDVSGCSWTDMGTVADYLTLHGQLLRGEVGLWKEFGSSFDKPFLCRQQTAKHTFSDWVCVGNDVLLPTEVHMERCVAWDGAVVEHGGNYHDVLLA